MIKKKSNLINFPPSFYVYSLWLAALSFIFGNRTDASIAAAIALSNAGIPDDSIIFNGSRKVPSGNKLIQT